jgi:hypothetical protein
MLFDLKGKRRRAVQGTYLTLAVLMGAGLVLFGIGSSTNGGLGTLFGNGGSGSNKGTEIQQNQIKAAQKTLAVQPKNVAALGVLIRNNYRLATSKQVDPNSFTFPKDAQPYLLQAVAAWNRYLNTNPAKLDTGLAQTIHQAYDALLTIDQSSAAKQNYYGGLAELYGLIAQQQAKPSAQVYILIAEYANAASKPDIAKRATARAVALAPKKDRKQVLAATKQPPPEEQTAQQSQGPQPVPGTGGK